MTAVRGARVARWKLRRGTAIRLWFSRPLAETVLLTVAWDVCARMDSGRVLGFESLACITVSSCLLGIGAVACIVELDRLRGRATAGFSRGFPNKLRRAMIKISIEQLIAGFVIGLGTTLAMGGRITVGPSLATLACLGLLSGSARCCCILLNMRGILL